MIEEFSYTEYRRILERFQPKMKDFQDIDCSTSEFCILRHDVEFSIERALKMAKIDNEYGIRSSFFVQVLNTAYNPLSVFNNKLLKQIESLGHYIGLHFYVSNIEEGDVITLQQELIRQTEILQACIDKKIDRFSYHRPPKWTLKLDTSKFSELINAYSYPYFEFIENGLPSKVKYIADSNHRWNYDHPLNIKNYRCFQLLIHPDEWSISGGDAVQNFSDIINEARERFIHNIDSEYKTFAEIRKFL